MKRKTIRKRGFSLVETIITLAVTIILLSTITSLIVAVVDARKRSVTDYEVSNNLYLAKNALYDWYDDFAGENFTAVVDPDGGIAVTAADKTFAVTFDKNSKTLTTPKYDGLALPTIDDIAFAVKSADGVDAIEVRIAYRGGSKPITMLFTGRLNDA